MINDHFIFSKLKSLMIIILSEFLKNLSHRDVRPGILSLDREPAIGFGTRIR